METLAHDIRHAVRTLRRRPVFTLVAATTLALGIGANTAIFSVVDSLLLRPLPLPGADRLVSLSSTRKGLTLGGELIPIPVSYPDYRDYRALDTVFSDAAAQTVNVARFRAGDGPAERAWVQLASDNYFSVLDLQATVGRTWAPEPGGTASPGEGAVLSHSFWQSRFAGDPGVVGRTVFLNDEAFTVMGVTPERFPGTSGVLLVDVYVPVTAWDRLYPESRGTTEDRAALNFNVIARLRPGVAVEDARAAAAVQAARLEREYPDSNEGLGVVLYPESMTRLEPSAAVYLPPIAAVFSTLVGLVLLIACANVANLLLAHAASRQKEVAIRAALGSGRWRIVRQLLTESVLLSLLGGALGLVIAFWATRVLASVRIASDVPLSFHISMDPDVFLFALAVSMATGVIAGLVPAVQAGRGNLQETLKEGGRGSGTGVRQRLRSLLVVSQVAVSLTLLISAGLFVRSMWNFAGMDLGFAVEDRAMLTVDAGLAGYDEERGRVFFRDLLDRVRATPGVRSAAMAISVPIGVGGSGSRVYVEGDVASREEQNYLFPSNDVSSDYFETMGIPILEGRPFLEEDTKDSRGVVIVNDVLAERLWPGEDPIGRRLSTESADGPFLEVVGVARVCKYNLPGESPGPFLYLPLSQDYRAVRILHVHTEGDARALLATIRGEVRRLDPDMPIFDARTMETHIREGKGAMMFQLGSGLVGSFGLIGMALACIGLYGVMAFSVGQRIHELGVRMALGASARSVLGLVLRQGLILAVVGLGFGLVGAFALTRSFGDLLVGVTPTDPLTFGGVAALLLAVALVAAWVPAHRATRVDPVEALRYE